MIVKSLFLHMHVSFAAKPQLVSLSSSTYQFTILTDKAKLTALNLMLPSSDYPKLLSEFCFVKFFSFVFY